MTEEFDKYINFIMESYNSDGIDTDAIKRANAYFAIGHQGMDDDSDDDTVDYCWLWFNGSLKVGTGNTHAATFGRNIEELSRFKGWYDTGKDLLSFVDRKQEVNSVDEIPERVYSHLMRRFNPKTIKVF